MGLQEPRADRDGDLAASGGQGGAASQASAGGPIQGRRTVGQGPPAARPGAEGRQQRHGGNARQVSVTLRISHRGLSCPCLPGWDDGRYERLDDQGSASANASASGTTLALGATGVTGAMAMGAARQAALAGPITPSG